MRHKNLKRILAFIMVILMTAALLPSHHTAQAATRKIPAKSIQLAKKTLTLNVGKTARIRAKVKPADAADKKLFYSSKNKAVATVNKKGKVTAVSEGTTKILVFTKNKTLKKKVTVHVTKSKDLSYAGYELKWQDDFNGTSLNRKDWNVETHEAGWVNSELQEYVDSDKNIYVKDGNLIIKPWKTGTGTYTSGRINTQGKHDFKYGLFEARVKVPKGKGFLPAFWMMPANENLYGQWPRCGEIDCMEVMGQETNKAYGTIHFGNPHSEKQNTYTLENGNFADEYHVFSCEWEPGKITWYVDGIKFHEANDWYSTTEGQGTVAYPAPFDQNFYMILNLAVGGSWVGNPDANDAYVDEQQFTIDYVKAYQKTAGYDESNVKKPEAAPVVIPDPDANGNYVHNSNFSVAEDLNDDTDWKFLTANEGEGSAKIQNNEIVIETQKEGTVDYSIQLVQPQIPAEEAAEYEIRFDAYADEARDIYVGISAPERGWKKYFGNEKAALTTTTQTFTYKYTMTDKTDAAARLEFNMGHTGSTATIHITKVSIKKTKQGTVDTSKKCLSDGNYVYNGSFQEGDSPKGLAYWNISGQMDASVTSLEDGRRLKAEIRTAGASISQEDLALTAGTALELSFDAEAVNSENKLLINIAGLTQTTSIATGKKHYSFKLTPETLENRNFILTFQTPGTVLLDNVRLVEDTLIKNGNFYSADNWYCGIDASVKNNASAKIENNKAIFDLKQYSDTSADNWHIQLKQEGLRLETGRTYELTFTASSSAGERERMQFGYGSGNLRCFS